MHYIFKKIAEKMELYLDKMIVNLRVKYFIDYDEQIRHTQLKRTLSKTQSFLKKLNILDERHFSGFEKFKELVIRSMTDFKVFDNIFENTNKAL